MRSFFHMDRSEYYFIDGNYYSKKKHTYKQAVKASKTLINCTGCIDCYKCTDCSWCEKCRECTYCYMLFNCEKCVNCSFCQECSECRELDFSYKCDNCFFSLHLSICNECMYLGFKHNHDFNNFNGENTMEQISNNLSQWREDRNITKDMQRDNFLTLIQEELKEYYEAKNVEEKIDALCDMAVITINSSRTDSLYPLAHLYPREITNPNTELGIQIDKVISSDFDDTETLNLLALLANLVEGLGYDFILAMHETVKEIASRRGAWSEEKGKWIKDTSEEAKKMWYKANYKKCRIIEKGWDGYNEITRYKGEI